MTLLILCQDIIGPQMAGPGIRYWEMARVLAQTTPVTIICPHEQIYALSAPNVTVGAYRWSDRAALAPWLSRATRIIANSFMLQGHPEIAACTVPLAIDLYDPTILENLEAFTHFTLEQRNQYHSTDLDLFQRLLATGDFFVCATERQRDLYLGGLLFNGRITPELVDSDPELRQFIDVAPFGLPAAPPEKTAPLLRGVYPGIPENAQIVLWTGGLWEWMDPLSAIEAIPALGEELPRLRLVFLAGTRPGGGPPVRMLARARERAAELELLGQQVIFYDEWVPYAQRGDALLEADIAISLHRNHLETRFAAVRSRFLDHLWAGLPSLVSGGDAAAELVERRQLGCVVQPDDQTALIATLRTMLIDTTARAEWASNARQEARHWRWKQTLAPLKAWVQRPAPVRVAPEPPSIKEHTMTIGVPPVALGDEHLHALDQLVQQSEQRWNTLDAATNHRAARQTLRLIQPFIEQQTDFNSLVVHLLYWLSEYGQREKHSTQAHQLVLAEIDDRLQTIQAAIVRLEDQVQPLVQSQPALRETLAALNLRLASEAEHITAIIEQLGSHATHEHNDSAPHV